MQQQQQQQQLQLQQLDAVVWADRDRLARASPRVWKTPRTRALPTARQLSVNGARPRPMSMPVAPQQYVPAGGAYGGAQAPLESSTSIRTEKSHSSSFVLGDYTLGKTLGAGSLDKVKLTYHNPTGEKLAIKILPRANIASTGMNGVVPTAEAAAKQASKEATKETRTIREAALSMLLHRPYVACWNSLRTRNTTTWCSSTSTAGRFLTTSSATAVFTSALPASSPAESALHSAIVTATTSSTATSRSRTSSSLGNSKIVDFVLSNLNTHLSTFFRSLCFAAPELLNVVTEPQVDFRSFGVTLYVLVCGKLPFDNLSIPALHAEIECGLVDCPDWLSAECKHLLIRMLVVIPSARALAEILSSFARRRARPPGYPRHVRFRFGSEDEIEHKLVDVLKSGVFARAVQPGRRNGSGGLSNASLACYDSALSAGSGSDRVCDTPAATPSKSRHFSGFDFYRHKLFSPGYLDAPHTSYVELAFLASSTCRASSQIQRAAFTRSFQCTFSHLRSLSASVYTGMVISQAPRCHCSGKMMAAAERSESTTCFRKRQDERQIVAAASDRPSQSGLYYGASASSRTCELTLLRATVQHARRAVASFAKLRRYGRGRGCLPQPLAHDADAGTNSIDNAASAGSADTRLRRQYYHARCARRRTVAAIVTANARSDVGDSRLGRRH
ncbi:hypothetical protein DFH11DRAFT_1881428 [Phellopilus nigrolimitatus]|nr:hypothetical protein DFH11DRAFT_1881428 [Phellopilus nigrolimitatus]